MKTYEFTVVLERDEDGRYVAICPALQGCYTEGESEAEALELIRDAVWLHIEARLERGEPMYEEVRASGRPDAGPDDRRAAAPPPGSRSPSAARPRSSPR